MPDLLLELHSDEIPARMQAQAAIDLQRLLEGALSERVAPGVSVDCHVTPNRLCAMVEGLPDISAGQVEERRGPRAGAPDKAISGFARSAGVEVGDLQLKTIPSGTFHFALTEKSGRPLATVIAEVVPEIIRSFPWPKSMRWGDGKLRWVRPLNSVLCILHEAGVARVVEFEAGGLNSGRSTRGHRLMSPGTFEVNSADEYRQRLREAKVILDASERIESIRSQLDRIAADSGLEVIEDAGLLEENAGLAEWPVVLLGEIDGRFRMLPPEILVTTMRSHLRFIALRAPESDGISHFAAVSNRIAGDGNRTILDGNRRVLNARLGDAEFAWNNDLATFGEKGATAELHGKLGRVTFHGDLGSQGQRVDRIRQLAMEIAETIGADAGLTGAAADFVKLDLLSETVGEFPELQGVIGRNLAERLELDETIGKACEQQYWPSGPEDMVPSDPVISALAAADRIDQIAGFFSIGLAPTGSRDPFALRRAALGYVRIVLENGLRLDTSGLLRSSLEKLQAQQPAERTQETTESEPTVLQPMEFIHERLVNYLAGHGIRADIIAACISAKDSVDLRLVELKARKLQDFLNIPGNEVLVQGFRRASNILKGLPDDDPGLKGDCNPALFSQPEESSLFTRQREVHEATHAWLDEKSLAAAIMALSGLVAPINGFFENVRVNVDDDALRTNRIRLLAAIRRDILAFADLSRVDV